MLSTVIKGFDFGEYFEAKRGFMMNKDLTINRSDLENTKTDEEYLQVIFSKYNEVWKSAPNRLMEFFSEEQISLLIYSILHDQVYNGGFLQLLFNGYANYIFGSPLSQSLREWGAVIVAEQIESIAQRCLDVSSEMNTEDKTLENLSDSYNKYPEFEAYDKQFYINDGSAEIKTYISDHLSDFISIA